LRRERRFPGAGEFCYTKATALPEDSSSAAEAEGEAECASESNEETPTLPGFKG